jgi:NAD(P)-dependent dehydrogenase (short-subunit alcohol dehydrogenase family)
MTSPERAGRVAVVTGAGSGIGRSLAVLLAREGAGVHVVDVDRAAVEEVAAAVRDVGGRATSYVVDVADAAAVERLAAEVFEAEGHVDLLFNNAGIGHAGDVVDTPLEDWRRVLEVNLFGVIHGVSAFVPRLVAQGRPATIVNTASMAGLLPVAGMVPYSTSKAGVVGLSEALDAELAPRGVRVLALCPGVIDTAIVRQSVTRGDWARRQERLTRLYATRGTSPDVVARDALAAVARGRSIVPTPRSQVAPMWLLKRWAPPLARAANRGIARFAARG